MNLLINIMPNSRILESNLPGENKHSILIDYLLGLSITVVFITHFSVHSSC